MYIYIYNMINIYIYIYMPFLCSTYTLVYNDNYIIFLFRPARILRVNSPKSSVVRFRKAVSFAQNCIMVIITLRYHNPATHLVDTYVYMCKQSWACKYFLVTYITIYNPLVHNKTKNDIDGTSATTGSEGKLCLQFISGALVSGGIGTCLKQDFFAKPWVFQSSDILFDTHIWLYIYILII